MQSCIWQQMLKHVFALSTPSLTTNSSHGNYGSKQNHRQTRMTAIATRTRATRKTGVQVQFVQNVTNLFAMFGNTTPHRSRPLSAAPCRNAQWLMAGQRCPILFSCAPNAGTLQGVLLHWSVALKPLGM